ncbi:MAG: DNA alkylation repair protein [Planctomycetes bacterium]|nr:DNA alkylation repair protein [Planctomycetota bacterium]
MGAFKDELGAAAVEEIGTAFARADNGFPVVDFRRLALDGIDELELKARVMHIMAALREVLPADYADALLKLMGALPHGTTQAQVSGSPDYLPTPAGLRGFAAWAVIDFVGEYGLKEPELSLRALPEMTSYFSAEFAVRPFLIHHEKLALRHMKKWASHKNEHVRRLASEGSRPILPWGIRLPSLLAEPEKVLPILQQLPNDPSNYVRRSVANHMNDISKNHPQWMIAQLKKWGGTELPWIRHGLRTLVKSGHAEVWPLLGYAPDLKVKVVRFEVKPKQIRVGEEITVIAEFELQQSTEAPVVVDYGLHLVRANGSRSLKVFKWKNTTLSPKVSTSFKKRHSFKPVTTRKYYPGTHQLDVQINGRVLARVEFDLV